MRQQQRVKFSVVLLVGWVAIMFVAVPGLAKDKKKKPDKNKPAEAAVETKDEANTETKAESTAAGKTHTVTRGPFKQQLEFDATVTAAHTTEVALTPEEQLSLIVREVVPHGTRVTKGQPLIKFDLTKLDEQIHDLEAARALAEINLQEARREAELIAKTAPLDAELALRSKQHAAEDLARFEKIDRAFREKSSEFSVKQVNNFLEYVQEELKQLEKMYKADDLTEETEEIVLKRARNDVEQMKYMVETVKYGNDRDKEIEIPRSLMQYQHTAIQAALLAERAKLSAPLMIEKHKLEAEKLVFEQRKAAEHLKRLERDRDKLAVTAPSDGVLYYGRWRGGKWTGAADVAQKLHAGAQVQAHDVTLTVVQPGPVEIQAAVPEKELAHVSAGIAGQFCPKAWPDQKLAARVQRLSIAPQSEGEFSATLTLDSSQPEKLVPGMTGKMKIVPYFKADAIAVPTKTVFRDNADEDKRYVLVVDGDGKHKRRDVTVGHSTEKLTEITAGLSSGEKILLEKPEDDAASTSEVKDDAK